MKQSSLLLVLVSAYTGAIHAQKVELTVTKPAYMTGITSAKFLPPGQKTRTFDFSKDTYPTITLRSGDTIEAIVHKTNGHRYETSFVVPDFDGHKVSWWPNRLRIGHQNYCFKRMADQ